jgi:hypothetical protein
VPTQTTKATTNININTCPQPMDPSALLESHGAKPDGVCDGAAVEAVPSPRRWRTRRTLLGALAAVAVAGVATGAVLGAAHLHTSESAVYNPDGSRVPTRAEYEASLVKVGQASSLYFSFSFLFHLGLVLVDDAKRRLSPLPGMLCVCLV